MLKNFKFNCLNINFKTIPIVSYLTSFFLLIFNPMGTGNIAVTSFNRIIGNGLLNGIDIEKRINNFYFWYLFLFPLLFFIIHIFISKIYNLTNENNQNIKNAREFLHYLSLLSMIPMIFTFINKFQLGVKIYASFSIVFSLCLIIATLFYMLLEKYIRVSFEIFKWIMFLSILISSLITFFVTNKSNFYYIVFILSFYTLLVISMFTISRNNLSENKIKQIQFAAIPSMYGLCFISLFLELTNILNQYNIIIHHKRFLSLLVCMLLVGISGILYLLKEKFNLSSFKWENWYYVALILSFSFIMVQPNLQTFVNTDLFESANHGLAVNEFFKYSKIPLIETFDAHMLSNSLWGIIYGLLNNDPFGAIFIPYGNYILPILNLLFYKLVKEFFDCDCDFAFFLTIFLPLQMPIIYKDFGFLGVIALIFALRKNNFKSYFIYWTSLVLICIYRLDNGAAYSFATFVTLLILCVFTRKKYDIKKIILSFITVISSCIILYLSICKWKGISFLDRLREILSLIRSNVNWAYDSIGSVEIFAFSFCYIIIPFLVITLLGSLHILSKLKLRFEQYIIITSLAIAYLFNLSRGMVRHSLLENQIDLVLFSSILFISLAVCLLTKKSKQIFIFTFIPLSLIVGLLISPQNIKPYNTVDSFFNRTTSNSFFIAQAEEKVDRVVLLSEFRNSFESTVSFINSLLDKNETYLDFTNQSLLYALSNKEKPVYVNQSPGLLSGEYSQKKFVEQVNKNDNVIFALMPKGNITGSLSTELDSIKNSFRYYIVSEYISKNFRPLCCNETAAMWVKKEKYDDILERCREKKNFPYDLCDYNYGIAEELHHYDLKQIPYIWGTYDCKKAFNNFAYHEALNLKENYYNINFRKINMKGGNYVLIKAKANSKGTCSLSLGSIEGNEFLQKSIFNFDLVDSKEPISYLIRVSSDSYWYSGLINSLKVESSTPLEKLDIQILQGD